MRNKQTFRIKARRDVKCPQVYSNFCEATHSPFDLTLTFCSLTGIQPEDLDSRDAGEAVVYAEPRTQVTVPFRIVPALIKMLEAQMQAVEEAENEPPSPKGPNFSLVH